MRSARETIVQDYWRVLDSNLQAIKSFGHNQSAESTYPAVSPQEAGPTGTAVCTPVPGSLLSTVLYVKYLHYLWTMHNVVPISCGE